MPAAVITRTAIELWSAYAPKRKRTGRFPCAITLADGRETTWITRAPGVVRFLDGEARAIAAYNDDGRVSIQD